jgi:response regulator RpfG family c-di-GMP phosphodiesterase
MVNASSVRLTEQLVTEGLVPAERVAEVAALVGRGAREEDALVESGAIEEGELLRWLARRLQTRFVATSKLARVSIDRPLLELIPRKLAEQLQVFPVVYEAASQTLSVVAATPQDPSLARTISQVAKVLDVRVYVARPAAVKAAIQKHYGGDLYAFAHTDNQGKAQYLNLLSLYDHNTVDPDNLGPVFPPADARAAAAQGVSGSGAGLVLDPGPTENSSGRIRVPPTTPQPAAPQPSPVGAAAAPGSLLEMATVLVSLLENSRGELRGHSATVARLLRKLAERMRLADDVQHALSIAALLHDVGKAATYHLTALNVAVFESHRTVAQKVFLTPIKLFDAVPLDPVTVDALQGMYERVDGQGFPEGLMGKDIPLAARLLSLADTYADLTQNARNPYRRTLTPAEACEVLDQQRDTVFDRNLVDLLRQTVTGEDLRARILSERTSVLLIDPDPEETTVLELRLLEDGFEVLVARGVDEALATLSKHNVEVCISETELDTVTGFELLSRVRAGSLAASVPWVFLTRDTRREAIARGYELGASDYVLKPASAEVLVAKVRQLLAQRSARQPRAVAGSLAELGFADVVQVLAQGRKSGVLRIQHGAETGEVHFVEGAIVHAAWGTHSGEAAFYQMVRLQAGEFALDPSARSVQRTITASAEMLLIEGMRLLDEAAR